MNLSALPLVLGVWGLVRICLRFRVLQAAAKVLALSHDPLSIARQAMACNRREGVITRAILIPRP